MSVPFRFFCGRMFLVSIAPSSFVSPPFVSLSLVSSFLFPGLLAMSVLLSASATELALLAGPVLGGFASAFYTRQETKSWYKTIQRPWFTPPNWVRIV